MLVLPCIHKDGMDQAKWSVPRNRHLRMTKSEMPLQKPKFKIQGVWTFEEKQQRFHSYVLFLSFCLSFWFPCTCAVN